MKKWFFMGMVLLISAALSAQVSDTTNYGLEDETQETEAERDESEEGSYEEETSYNPVEPEDLKPTEQYRKEKMRVRSFDQKKWQEIVGTTDYNEEPEEKEKEKEGSSVPTIASPWSASALKPIAYIIIFGAIALILYYVLKNTTLGLKIEKTEMASAEAKVAEVDDLHSLDFEAMLKRARSEGNYRLAVRLYYLELLKALHTRGYIQWKKDKTNADYLAELFAINSYFDEVRSLTLAYEQVWYGEHSLTGDSFQRLSGYFENMQEALTNQEAK